MRFCDTKIGGCLAAGLVGGTAGAAITTLTCIAYEQIIPLKEVALTVLLCAVTALTLSVYVFPDGKTYKDSRGKTHKRYALSLLEEEYTQVSDIKTSIDTFWGTIYIVYDGSRCKAPICDADIKRLIALEGSPENPQNGVKERVESLLLRNHAILKGFTYTLKEEYTPERYYEESIKQAYGAGAA